MNSIKAKLTVWLIVGVTIILGITGFISYANNKRQGEADYQALRLALKERLALSLPHGVWQLDDQYIRLTLDAELGWPSLTAIRIRGDAGLNVGRIRDGKGGIRDMTPSEQPSADDILKVPIVYQGKELLGEATVFLSRQSLASTLQARLMEIIAQIIVLDILILILMTYALRHFVFHPLTELQMALNHAASSDALNDATLEFKQDNEFGEVARSFNRIVTRIMDELSMRTAAEASAQDEKQKAQDAYRRLLETQQTLVEAEKLASLGGLVAGVAHEINTPVGITLTTASHLATVTQHLNGELQNGSIRKSDFQNYLQTASESCDLILANAERAANLIHSFKQVAVDQTSEARRDFQLNEYLHEIITSLRPRFKRSRIDVEIACEEDILMDSYPGALSQVITNLVVNAQVHAFDEGAEGKIRIEAQHGTGTRIVLKVTDNGRGIPSDNLPKIFQPFFTTRRSSGGSGLGLHIVYNIVRQRLGGTIEVASRTGEGTVFTIEMPSSAPEQQQREVS
ncbi:sensor histidine kinase [Paludibacterium paludis]|uniref:histidine kinase n=1 Tax=Paludibacterium paludis TaxID=1225769 RepID=A0A918NWQ4_9NEIS|nr:ATP-binding protein [Paludibacterium paludis]GGY02547.1 hypothetical protein GCM10011289_00860 [Paludibacterium paludis]